MAEFARRRGFTVEVAKFEEWNAGNRTFDTIIAGTTWHWVDPVAGAQKAAELLRPSGLLAAFWNVGQPPPELARAFSEVYGRVLPGMPFAASPTDALDAYERILDRTSDGIRAAGAFGEPDRWRLDWERPYTTEEWLELVPTFGGHSQFPPAKLEELLSGVGAAVDAAGGTFTMRYAAVAVIGRREP
jgi:SAM-dependent methyltransferase